MYLYFFIAFVINLGILAFLNYSVAQKIKGKPNIFFRSSLSETPEWFGVRLGLKLSLALSITYAFLGVFIVQTFIEPDSGNFLFVWALGSPIIFFIAILPAVIYGVLTGLFLGMLTNNFKHRFSSITFIMLGIALCAVITVLSHYIFNIQVVLSFDDLSTGYMSASIYETYPFYIGIPSIVYTLSGGWASWYIFKRFELEQKLL